MLYLVAGIIGFILGLFFMAYGIAIKIVGTIRVDSSNEDGPYLFLELDKPLSDVLTQKYVVVNVDTSSYIPQK